MARFSTWVLLAVLAGCGHSPQSLGLTGNSLATPPEAPTDNLIRDPGIPQGDSPYNPSVLPTTGGGRYYGY